MVDRIDKTDRVDTWKIAATAETHKEKEQHSSAQEDGYASFSEKTDWRSLFDKSRLWKKDILVSKDQISKVVFRKINLKTDPSLLRVDVHLKTGELIDPAFLAISRALGLKIKNLVPGNSLDYDSLLQAGQLRLTIPSNPALFREEKKVALSQTPSVQKNASHHFSRVAKQVSNNFLAEIFDSKTKQFKPEAILIAGLGGIILFLMFGILWVLR